MASMRNTIHEYPPDGLLTLGNCKHDVAAAQDFAAPDPFASDDCLDDLLPHILFLLTTTVEADTMNTGEPEPSSGLNGRLRPRKSNIPSPKTTHTKTIRKHDTKPALDKPKRTSTPSKATPTKQDDLIEKPDSPAAQCFCPYCDKTFVAKQALAKHVRRLHIPISKQDIAIPCLFCTHVGTDANAIIRHMIENHPNQYFACSECDTRFPSTAELAEHRLNVCENQKLPYRNKLRQKVTPKKSQKNVNINGRNEFGNSVKEFSEGHGFNGIVISCELKSSGQHDLADIEDNITTNFILPPGKSLVNGAVIEKNAVIILDELQWSKRVPPNFTFQNADADQILSRLGVVHRSPRESHGREWLKNNDDSHQKFEKCFDTSFYSKVASNVQENLAKFLDGSCNFNPDPENTIKTRKAKNIVAINTVEGFPILLACEQFSRNGFDGYMPRAIAPKHKWKWDNLENDKSLMSPDQIKRDSHTNNCIISLVSSLDIWTQLCMRRKFESKFHKSPIQKKTEKQSIIGKQLKEILESRELPASSSQVVKFTSPPATSSRSSAAFPACLGLVPTAPSFDLKPAVLSGEWVRPRCYVCCACGTQTFDSKSLSSHISTQHPNGQIQHYEIVGEVLLNSDILKHLYVPPSQMSNRTRPLRGFRDCTKCKKSISLEDLHQHMLDCAGDTPTVRRKCRYRPFGVRKRRPRLPDNTIRQKIRKEIRTRHSRKNRMRPRQKIRTEVGDAETIRKMIADLPAKRHRAMVKPLNPTIRPRINLRTSRTKLVLKKRITEETKNSQEESSSRGNAGAASSKKNSRDPDDRVPIKSFKTTVTRVASKILRKQDSFNKKNITKSKRKIVAKKHSETNIPSVVNTPTQDSDQSNIPLQQLSVENNPERININNGSYNTREHGDRSNNNSYNRDGQSPEPNNGQNNNARDPFAPSQSVPLKHSIASLTASSETQDKAVQFHHLFLIQQECNNVNQQLPAGQRMLFENEAVVTKLDKPPLHFNPPRPLDLQVNPKSKLNNGKPRKGLNDCIAMLKNKLVEPNSKILTGHVSVQCGDDEPLIPEPIITVERRYSTTDINTEYVKKPDYISTHIPKKAIERNSQTVTSKSRVTRRSNSTRHGHSSRSDKAPEMLTNNEIMQWRQFYYGSQMLNAQNINESYTKRQSSRRRNSLVPTDDLLFQHTMNLEFLNQNKQLAKYAEYHQYPSGSTLQNSSKKSNRRDSQKNKTATSVQSTRSKTKDNVTTRGKNAVEYAKQSHRSKSVNDSPSTKRQSDKPHTKSAQTCNTVVSVERIVGPYSQEVVVNETSAARLPSVRKSTEGQLTRNITRKTPVVQYASNTDIPSARYAMHLEIAPSGPIDLSNKTSNVEDSVQYISQEQFPVASYDAYETLDLSNKNLSTLPVRDTQINSDDVVDLRINYATHSSFQPRYIALPSDLVNNEIEEDNATDLSLRREEEFPTDLSMYRRDYRTPTTCYEKSTIEEHRRLPINYIEDFSNPIRHIEDECVILHEYINENSERIVVVESEPTDLSSGRNPRRSNLRIEQPMHLNAYASNTELDDENLSGDWSGKSVPFRGPASASINNAICSYDNFDNQQAQHCMNSDQMINFHYDLPIHTSSETNFSRTSHRTSITYCEPTEHYETTSDLVAITEDLINTEASVNRITNYEELNYPHSEMPLSLVSNTALEGTNTNSLCNTKSNESAFEMTKTAYTVANDCISVTKTEPTLKGVTMDLNTLIVDKTIDTVKATMHNNLCGVDLAETHNPFSSSGGKKEITKLASLTPTNNCSIDTDKRKGETVDNSKIKNSDSDPETARKIAMLPKELVEILGTMPVDHRNQLLNVLPQYVSTSTSPISHTNTVSERSNSESSSGNLVINTKTVSKVSKEFEGDSEDGPISNSISSKNMQFTETSPISVSSSILLTPPTPQLSERYSLQSQEMTDIQIYDTKKSRTSTEEQTPATSVDSHKLSGDPNMLAVKRLTNIDYNDPDRVIDLTVDENSSKNTDVTNIESVTHSHMVAVSNKDESAVISDPKVPKTSSDKTASLRAVRIKTPSERHRSMLGKNTQVKKQNKVSLNVNVQEDTSKNFDNISPMAIQQTEISSTQQRSVQKNSHPPAELPKEKFQKSIEKKLILKKDNEKSPIISESAKSQKLNTVTSTLSKDTNSNLNNDRSPVVSEDISETSVEVNVSSLKIPYSDNNANDKIETILEMIEDVPTKENFTVENQSSFDTRKESSDDSEDDVSLAVIVKQKQRDSVSVLELQQSTKIDLQSKQLSGIKKKRKTKTYNKLKDVSLDKPSSDPDKLAMNKIGPTGTIIEVNLPNKDRVSNESNVITKRDFGKKNPKKGRRQNHAQSVKLSADKNEQSNDTKDYEKEINKENNVSSDIGKTPEESFKLKCSEQDPHQSSAVNTDNSKDIPNSSIKKDKGKKMLEINIESGQSTDDMLEINKDVTENAVQSNATCKLPQKNLNSAVDVQHGPQIQSSTCNESEKILCKNDIIITENLNEKLILNSDGLKQGDVTKPEKSEKSSKTKKVSMELCTATGVNSELEETNVTPLRRSRRGKSLFIDSNYLSAVNPALQDTATNEQKAPLTKKQLIFSKLLLDEENYNKTTEKTSPILYEENVIKTCSNIPNHLEDNQITPLLSSIINQDEKNDLNVSPNIQEEQDLRAQAQGSLSEIEPPSTEKHKSNKRKMSLQSKRKPKKKKSFTNVTYVEDTEMELPLIVNTENDEILKSKLENKEISPLMDEESLIKNTSEVNDCVTESTNSDSTKVSSKTISIEKRKSSSPHRYDSFESSKPKKCKLNDEKESAVPASFKKDNEHLKTVEIKTAENNSTITSRNNTCYNKPARRARSKSVVVKSSGTEFYDPYDIDLEDMVEKTEPFVRKEVSKISFHSFKSSVAVRTRNLSKTAPSAIIDISPTEFSENTDKDVLICEDIESHIGDKVGTHLEVLNAKDGISDSDESTKSDVPLKKYAEEKEKKLAEISQLLDRNKRSETNNINESKGKLYNKKAIKKNNRSVSINKKEENTSTDKIDKEKDLRSEQFMESFGFFSERKPRKSNLLATKKISETFHIIANDSDDVYFSSKQRSSKKGAPDNRKEDNRNLKTSSSSPTKKTAKRSRKKKSSTPIETTLCTVCKKSFRRSDNFMRHQMTLYHVSRLCEVELKVKSVIIEEEPNYLIVYKQQLERLKMLQDKTAKRKKNGLPTSDIILPTLEEIFANVKRTIREQELSRRELSRDEALFLDCCEMLNQSHNKDIPPENKCVRQCNSFNCPQTCEEQLPLLGRGDKCDIRSDEDVDSMTAKSILESDEVRNLENDLISNLKEASGFKGFSGLRIKSSDEVIQKVTETPTPSTSTYQKDVSFETIEDSTTRKPKRSTEVKDNLYSNNLNDTINMFEDKFDKIKRKCRSQAAAAKQIQTQVDPNPSYKHRKKADKRKAKKSSKKSQNVVPTKGALKVFDGIKVSILKSDINMSAIVPSVENSFKKKRKSVSKKKRERKSSGGSSKSESDHVIKESSQKKVDVYEFLDTEDTELFEFRPSTLMERFKSICNKDLPSTSKTHAHEQAQTSSDSVSDGDDFVYMDDLLFSEDETENSILSCELGGGKSNTDTKKSTPLKRKDVIEKNAVMGKIFKHNAVRSDKKNTKHIVKPKANLDQLFDSLLESEPTEKSIGEDIPKEHTQCTNTYCNLTPPKEKVLSKPQELPPVVLSRKPEPSMSVTTFEELISQRNASVNKYESSKEYNCAKAKFETYFNKHRDVEVLENDDYISKYNDSLSTTDDDYTYRKHKSKDKSHVDKPSSAKRRCDEKRRPRASRMGSPEEPLYEDAGVARQRARRKCTVGKQNVLAETWSSESEPDAAPPRPNSAESAAAVHARRRKSRKRAGRALGARPRPAPGGSEAEDDEPEHPQQHGWIVGDSHKKLVTMLAHAKGRKRSYDDRRQLHE